MLGISTGACFASSAFLAFLAFLRGRFCAAVDPGPRGGLRAFLVASRLYFVSYCASQMILQCTYVVGAMSSELALSARKQVEVVWLRWRWRRRTDQVTKEQMWGCATLHGCLARNGKSSVRSEVKAHFHLFRTPAQKGLVSDRS